MEEPALSPQIRELVSRVLDPETTFVARIMQCPAGTESIPGFVKPIDSNLSYCREAYGHLFAFQRERPEPGLSPLTPSPN